MAVPTLFDLTPLTKDANQKRRVVVQGWDVDRRVFILFLVGLAPAAIVTAIAAVLVGPYALFVFVGFYFPLGWLFLGRSSKGMELSNWRSLLTRQQSNRGHFVLRGERMDPERNRPRVIQSASRPGPGLVAATATPTTVDDLFA